MPVSTYTWGDAISLVGQFHNRNFEASFAAMVADQAQSAIWHSADWTVTIGELPPFWLVPLEQDYGAPVATIPADFAGLRQGYLVNTLQNPPRSAPLGVNRFLQQTELLGAPANLSYEHSNKKFRVFPRPSGNFGCPNFLITGTYKKLPTKLTPTTYLSALVPWDDEDFNTVVSVTRLTFYNLLRDQSPDYARRYMEMYPVAEALLQKMMADEGLNTGDQLISPSGVLPLGWYGSY